jgi:SPP1 family predicted phage head-tail adaptor
MKPMSPADMDKRITLQYETSVPDGLSGTNDTWVDAATVWAKKTTHRSDEAVQAMKETGVMVHNFRIHYRTDVDGSWRIKQGNAIMSIIGQPVEVNEGSSRYLDITVKEAK